MCRMVSLKMAANGKGFAMCGLCAKYIQPHIAKPVLPAGAVYLAGFRFENEKKILKVLEYEIYGK